MILRLLIQEAHPVDPKEEKPPEWKGKARRDCIPVSAPYYVVGKSQLLSSVF